MKNKQWIRPKVIISKCLEFDACRYNGEKINDNIIKKLIDYIDFIPVCPEVEIGLGIPRETIRLINQNEKIHLIEPTTANNYTDKMNEFSDRFLRKNYKIDGFILKSRSPSCGVFDVKVYESKENSSIHFMDSGLFASSIKRKYPNLPIEEEGRLANYKVREHFLISIYTIAHFRQVKNQISMKKIIDFHTRNKYLFMMYNPSTLKEMGKLIGSMSNKSLPKLADEYYGKLLYLFSKRPSKKLVSNVFLHLLGYFKKYLTKSDKLDFFEELEKYNANSIQISALKRIIMNWLNEFNQEYLKGQSFFQPFPHELNFSFDSKVENHIV